MFLLTRLGCLAAVRGLAYHVPSAGLGSGLAGLTWLCSAWSLVFPQAGLPAGGRSVREQKMQGPWGLSSSTSCYWKQGTRQPRFERHRNELRFSIAGVTKSYCKGRGYMREVENWSYSGVFITDGQQIPHLCFIVQGNVQP